MSQKTYRTANGQEISIESLRLQNEKTIAVGNMKVNARGDQLGPGGVPQITRQGKVNEFYNLHTPTVSAAKADEPQVLREQAFEAPVADPIIAEQDAMEDIIPEAPPVKQEVAVIEQPAFVPHNIPAPAGQKPVRGSLASAVAGRKVDVKQELMPTMKQQIKSRGPSRI